MGKSGEWIVYILRCADQSLYTGITNDIDRRIQEHNHDQKLSSKYTWARRPSVLIYAELAQNRSTASSREIAIKKLSHKKKLQLIKLSMETERA